MNIAYPFEKYNSLNDAFLYTLRDIDLLGENSYPRDRETKELIGYGFSIINPRDRLIFSNSRKINLFYCIGNFLWVMSQSDDVEFISYYNPKGYNFSNDGKKLPGAYGKRIFDMDGINQYYQCIRELKLDPDSRRALISIHLPQYDWRGVLDTPCTADFQLFIRNNKLHMINHMRSQSAAMVMPYDIFLMTMIHEFAACELDMELGEYIHFCNSIHFYKEEQNLVDKLLEQDSITFVMKQMPKGNNQNNLNKILQFERNIREKAIHCNNQNLKIDTYNWLDELYNMSLPEYWEDIGKILIWKALDFTNCMEDISIVLNKIDSAYSFFKI